MKKFMLGVLSVVLMLSGCLTPGDGPSNNKRELVFQETWDGARALVLRAFEALEFKVTKNDSHDGWVYLIDGQDAEGYKVKVMVFQEEHQVSGEVVGEPPEGTLLWGDTPQTKFLDTLKALSPKLKVSLAPPGPSEAPAP